MPPKNRLSPGEICMKPILPAVACLALLLPLAAPCMAEGGKSVSELRQLAQAGGSLIVDMRNRRYTVTELLTIAAGLLPEATLTVKMDRGDELSAEECLQLARSHPGQIRFWC